MAEEYTYTPPELLDDTDVDVIHKRMLDELPINIDRSEGGFVWDMTRPSAMEKSYTMEALNVVVQSIFPEWADGYILDLHARRCGITRRDATYATGYVHVAGTGTKTIPEGFLFCTPATMLTPSVSYATQEEVTLAYNSETETYEADIPVMCTEAGLIGNCPAHGITVMASPIQGITEIYNENAFEDGADTETDDDLRERVIEFERNWNTSFVGNNADYRRWALEVDGVGSASVIPEWQGTGTGTVKVVILTQQGGQASEALMTAVYDHIMGDPNDPYTRLAPIGAILTVSTGTPMTINITANVEMGSGATLETIAEAFTASLVEYFKEAKDEGEVKYTRIARCLSQTPGVTDYRQLLINGTRNNLTVGAEDLPAITSLTLQDANAEQEEGD